MTCQDWRKRLLGSHLPFVDVLHSIQADVPTGNCCRCFWRDTFNNTLLKCPWSDNQPIGYICGDADER